ncbi:MAG: M48 family metallopeptidase [Paludibacteraceae bacterium]|nr:M48 family metallopeptidase [Paludibacteraceae bacterium]
MKYIDIFGRRLSLRRHRRSRPDWRQEVTDEQKRNLIDFLDRRVEYWRVQMGEGEVTWKLRNMKSQWGNCRYRERILTFNLQLALVDDDLKDYIIVHELSHLQIHNHGPLFKARQSEFIPDWPQRRKLLKEYIVCILQKL